MEDILCIVIRNLFTTFGSLDLLLECVFLQMDASRVKYHGINDAPSDILLNLLWNDCAACRELGDIFSKARYSNLISILYSRFRFRNFTISSHLFCIYIEIVAVFFDIFRSVNTSTTQKTT